MPSFYFSQESIFFIYNIIFLALLFVYYLRLPNKSYISWVIIAGASAIGVTLLLGFIIITTVPRIFLYTLQAWQHLFTLYGMIALLQFLYIFPSPRPYLQETKPFVQISYGIAAVITVVLIIASIWGTLTQITWLSNGLLSLILLCIVGSLVVLVRRLQADLWQPSGQRRFWTMNWLMTPPTLIAPHPKNSIAALVSLTSAILLLLLPISSIALRNAGMLPNDRIDQIDFLFISITIFLVTLTLINYTPERTTILIKLVGIGLLTIMIIINSLIFFLMPLIRDAYEPMHIMAEQQQIRFTPVQEATTEIKYSVDVVSTERNSGSILTERPHTTHMDESGQSSLGKPLSLGNEQHRQIALPFEFPFYGDLKQYLFISDNGFVTFDHPSSYVRFRMHRQQTIAPLMIDLNPEKGGDVFVQQSQEKITMTWFQLVSDATEEPNTFQLTLYVDGRIEFFYAQLNLNYTYLNFENALHLIGILPGDGSIPPPSIRFTEQLRHTGNVNEAIVENFVLDYQTYLHRQMWPIALVLLGTMLAVLIGFPLFFRTAFIYPLRTLLDGVERVNAGEL
ncbi:MAG: hypothetical protein AAF639_44725, partial [Chloroflexota bacterium]